MTGRPYIYGLAVSGQKGASAVLDILAQELDRALILPEVSNIGELIPDLLQRRGVARDDDAPRGPVSARPDPLSVQRR
jgi:isopentenyl diphosphate isomerase/L-lactate dehydrogenase-like FMN-dependent dehydrogenase